MNKYQEALDKLAYILEIYSIDIDDKDIKKVKDCLNILQELVDKATPKKPTKGKTIYNDYETIISHNCSCGRELSLADIYCGKCGQKIDWSNVKQKPRDLEAEVYEELCVGCSDEKICHEECDHCVQFYERLEEKENE